jgi:hypothetical protein
MVVEHYIDLQDDTGQIGLTALRCMSCGEVIDPVILQNRERPAPNLLYGTNSCMARSSGSTRSRSIRGKPMTAAEHPDTIDLSGVLL